jgi:hypothetical protein
MVGVTRGVVQGTAEAILTVLQATTRPTSNSINPGAPRPRTTGPPAPHAAFVRRRDSPPRPSGRVATAPGANELDGMAVGHQGRGSDPPPEAPVVCTPFPEREDATGMKVIVGKGRKGGSCPIASLRGLDRGARAGRRGVRPGARASDHRAARRSRGTR